MFAKANAKYVLDSACLLSIQQKHKKFFSYVAAHVPLFPIPFPGLRPGRPYTVFTTPVRLLVRLLYTTLGSCNGNSTPSLDFPTAIEIHINPRTV